MIKYIFIFLLLNIKTCDCGYSGRYSKVVWNSTKESFANEVMDVDEYSVSLNIFNCSKKKGVLEIKGKVIDDDILVGNKQHLDSEAVILKCDENGKILDTLFNVKNDGNFYFKTIVKKESFLVLKLRNEQDGMRYNVADF